MPLHYEAYPQGFPQFAVPVIEAQNASNVEHSRALAEAAEEAARRYRAEYPNEKFGAAILYACHEDIPADEPTRAASRSVVY